jgi:hypothetical protein
VTIAIPIHLHAVERAKAVEATEILSEVARLEHLWYMEQRDQRRGRVRLQHLIRMGIHGGWASRGRREHQFVELFDRW